MKKDTQKVAMTSENIENENLQKLRAVFPQFVKDGFIDFDSLQAFFKKEGILAGTEKYGLSWAGKSKAFGDISRPATGTITPQLDESKNWDTTENIFIEGENLEVLKLLQKKYANPGKIKICYLDPPYNTGKDFIYKDNFTQNVSDYYDQTGQTKGGIKLTSNPESNGRYHSDWLTMMYSRLFLARNLLTDDGVIFVSIDDNEVGNLRMIMDEIFGEENFLGCAARVAKKSNNKGDFWAPNFDYILTYAKNLTSATPFFGGVNYEAYDQTETEGPRKGEKYQLVRLYMSTIENRNPEQRFYIDCPDGTKIIPPGSTFPPERPILGDGIWRWTRKKFNEERDRIVVKKVKSSNLIDENGNPAKWNVFTKTYLNDVIKDASAKPNSLVEDHINQIGSHELGELDIPFDYPKPSTLIKYLMEISRVDDDAIILDFFAGSGSTAQAVMTFNALNSTRRKFVLVQLPEVTDEKSEEYKAGYKTISALSRERIRRAGEKIKKENKDKKGIEKLDIGFKAFSLSQSNYRKWNTLTAEDDEKALLKQAKLFLEKPLVDGYDEKSVVYEILEKEGFDLNSFVQAPKKDQKDLPLWVVVDKGEMSRKMTITFAKKVTKEDIAKTGIGETDNEIFVCFDSALDDTTKVNIGRQINLKVI